MISLEPFGPVPEPALELPGTSSSSSLTASRSVWWRGSGARAGGIGRQVRLRTASRPAPRGLRWRDRPGRRLARSLHSSARLPLASPASVSDGPTTSSPSGACLNRRHAHGDGLWLAPDSAWWTQRSHATGVNLRTIHVGRNECLRSHLLHARRSHSATASAGTPSIRLVGRWPSLWPLLLIGWGVGLLRGTPDQVIGGGIAALVFGVIAGGLVGLGFASTPISTVFGGQATGTPFTTQSGAFAAPSKLDVELSSGGLAIPTRTRAGRSRDCEARRIATIDIDDGGSDARSRPRIAAPPSAAQFAPTRPHPFRGGASSARIAVECRRELDRAGQRRSGVGRPDGEHQLRPAPARQRHALGSVTRSSTLA